MEVEVITPDRELVEELRRRNYVILSVLGSGCTSDVFEVEYRKGKLRKKRVLKVLKEEPEESSITTLINLSKGDLNEREVVASNEISHPNIMEVFDNFQFQGRTAIISEHNNGVSLAELIDISGPITDPLKFKEIVSPIISGLEHLNVEERILHRDLKPSNVVINKKTSQVKLIDLQNACSLDEKVTSFLPTRGGTNYTALYLLNAILNHEKTKASIRSELYSLGATMYYILTGKTLFDFKLAPDELASPKILLRGKKIGIKLTKKGMLLRDIDFEKHRKELKEKIKQVPKQYEELLNFCLTKRELYEEYENPQNPSFAYETLKFHFKRATKTPKTILWEKVRKGAALYLIGGTILSGLIVGGTLSRIMSRNARNSEPSLFEMFCDENFKDSGIDFIVKNKNSVILDQLKPYFKEIKEELGEVNKENHSLLGGGYPSLTGVCNTHKMNKRMTYALFRSIFMQGSQYNSKKKMITFEKTYPFKAERYPVSLAPAEFYRRQLRSSILSKPEDFKYLTYIQCAGAGVSYLKRCIGSNSSLADVYALYFSDNANEIFEARKRAGTTDYFSKEIINEKGEKQVIKGYGSCLHPIKRQLINRALALFYISDKQGDVHLELLDSNNKPISGLAAK
jgi:serine/threonine protein kinase